MKINVRICMRRRPWFPDQDSTVLARSTWTVLALLIGLVCLTSCRGRRPAPPLAGATSADPAEKPLSAEKGPWLMKQFIYDEASFPSAHASTLVDTPHGVVAGWFGGSDEGNRDVGIWTSRYAEGRWTAPALVAEGVDPGWTGRYPCWNPVLVQMPMGPLILFYKVGPSPREWWGMRVESTNYGRTWSVPERLPEGILGPVRNKPVLWADGVLLCGSSTEDRGWRIHMEQSPDGGKHWSRTPPLNDAADCGLIQPTVLAWPNGRVQILCRSRQGAIYESWMDDAFEVWSKPVPIGLPNPNSGIDGVVLEDGRAVLVYNHTRRGRSPLNIAVSRDGRTWNASVILEDQPGEYSYIRGSAKGSVT
jgi:predicted neuraminidase